MKKLTRLLAVLLFAALPALAQPVQYAPKPCKMDGTDCSPVTVTTAMVDHGGQVYNAKAYGLTCDGSADDTSAFNALLATVYAAGGGTIWLPGICRINGAVLFPNDGLTQPSQPYIRITGAGTGADGQWGVFPTSPSGLDLRYAGGPKLDTRGRGLLEIDHVVLKDGGSDSVPFIFTTNTTLHIHDTVFSGTASGFSAQNDAIVCGGTTITQGGLATSPFQGYGTIIRDNWFDKIRRGVWGRVYFNGAMILNNTWSVSCGSNLTTTISAASNAAAAVLTSVAHGLPVGTTYSASFSGATGNWTPINGIHAIIPLTVDTFSIPVDSTTFGALTGSPVYLSGGAVELDGTGAGGAPGEYCVGNTISGNLVEMVHYPSLLVGSSAQRNVFADNTAWDATGATIAFYRLTNSNSNLITQQTEDNAAFIAADTATSGWNSYLRSGASAMSVWAQPWTFKNTAQFSGIASGDVPVAGANGLLTRDDGLSYAGTGSTFQLIFGTKGAGMTEKTPGVMAVTNGSSGYGGLTVASQTFNNGWQVGPSNYGWEVGWNLSSNQMVGTSASTINWTSGTRTASPDIGIGRSSAGVVIFTDGSTGGAAGAVGGKVTAFTSASAAAVNIADV
ncbi:MAG: hypothetical protein ACHRXM_37110, partial [Isosphaerales bacterium]